MPSPQPPRCSKALALLFLCSSLAQAAALEFRSTAEHGTAFFDAPSTSARKLFVTSRGYPVEVLTENKDWIRVRDPSGTLAWVEKKGLATKRSVIVSAPRADILAQADAKAAPLFSAEKNVTLEWVETGPSGWAKVRHRDGRIGFVRIQDVWGL